MNLHNSEFDRQGIQREERQIHKQTLQGEIVLKAATRKHELI